MCFQIRFFCCKRHREGKPATSNATHSFAKGRTATHLATALGAAYLAGLAVGYYKKPNIVKQWQIDNEFKPKLAPALRTKLYDGWKKAVTLSMGWGSSGKK